MDDVKLALLGDRAAQERITARGEMLPCPFCGAEDVETDRVCGEFFVQCNACKSSSEFTTKKEQCIQQWNTRASILSAEELEMINNG